MEYTLIATATFGLEKVVANELKELGYDDLTIENGKVTFVGDERDIVTCNMWLRTADRVLIKMAEFKAESFEELFQGTNQYLGENIFQKMDLCMLQENLLNPHYIVCQIVNL